ncbi:MAG: bifunctional serine/threonine-protein kinase/formylglycine-generating enzyme family protein [Bdellovibrionota bacterium]
MKDQYPIPFGKYLLTRRIAVGGMAEVFKAKLLGAKGFEKTLALKKILPEYSQDEEFLTMFIDEARISSNLAHPNIVQVFDFGEIEHQFYLAMEYIDGTNLKNLFFKNLRSGHQLRRETTYLIIQKIASALDYAHHVQLEDDNQFLHLVHRDVSPQNILISRLGEIKITDFGIAKAAIKLSQTQPGKIQGKYSYMSPEQALGKPLDRRSDIFSLGIIFYELLSNRKVYGSTDTIKRYKQATKAEIPRISSIVNDLPAQIDDLIMRMLARDPKDRPQGCDEIVNLLSEFLSNLPTEHLSSHLGVLVSELFPNERSVSLTPGGEGSGEQNSNLDAKEYYLNEQPSSAKKKPRAQVPEILLSKKKMIIGVAIGLMVSLSAVIVSQLIHSKPRNLETSPSSIPTASPPLSTPLDSELPIDPSIDPENTETEIEPLAPDYSQMTPDQLQVELQKINAEIREIEAVTQSYFQTSPKPRSTAVSAAPSCPSDMEMISKSTFLYGSSPDDPDRMDLVEFMASQKTVPAFCIDRYENPNQLGSQPQVNVSYQEAANLCSQKSKRLCSDMEWERACKGPASSEKNREFPYSGIWEQNVCNAGNAKNSLADAGSFTGCKTSEGLFDMIGNAEEWTTGSGKVSPDNKIIKGGSLESAKFLSRCSALKEEPVDHRSSALGFRCCKSVW